MYDVPMCRCGEYAQYRVMKKGGISQPVASRKPRYCYACARVAADKRIRIEREERIARIASGNPKDCDILQGLAEDLREWVARRLEENGYSDAARAVSETPIIMNSQYRR